MKPWPTTATTMVKMGVDNMAKIEKIIFEDDGLEEKIKQAKEKAAKMSILNEAAQKNIDAIDKKHKAKLEELYESSSKS